MPVSEKKRPDRIHANWRAEIPVAPFQQRFRELQRRGVSAEQIARNLDWYVRRRPDSQRLMRALGLKPYRETRAQKTTKETIRWRKTLKPETAKKLAEAMYADPVDLGF